MMPRLPLGGRDGGVARLERRTLREHERVQALPARLDMEDNVASIIAANRECSTISRREDGEDLFDHGMLLGHEWPERRRHRSTMPAPTPRFTHDDAVATWSVRSALFRSLLGVEVTIERGAGDAQRLADVRDRVGVVIIERPRHRHLRGGVQFLRPSPLPPPRPRRRQPRLGPLADQIALELRQCAEDVEDQLAATRRRVDLLGEALEADPPAR